MAWVAPLATALTAAGGTYAAIRASKGQNIPKPPGPPNQDIAANAAAQQDALLRQRRGVMGNIFGGAAGQPATTATNASLGL
jgi:hypothetical protein